MSAPAFLSGDQRRSNRLVVMRQGVIVTGGGRRLRCMIVDVGVGGARLQVFSARLPEGRLTLLDPTMATVHELRPVWRRGPLTGVAFLASAEMPLPERDAA